ncbi:MAG TPA: YncE family protein [Pyrinomonadaceae bacterium]|nr:YncE family protein [Pyrinomonadaceae bacterium]
MKNPAARPTRAPVLSALAALCFAATPLAAQQKNEPQPQPATTTPAVVKPVTFPQKFTRDGINVEFAVEPLPKEMRLMEETEALVTFKLTDAATHNPVTNLRPAAWLDRKEAGATTDLKTCRDKIQAFMQASLSARPELDLNSYYVLALNQEANISVINPLGGFRTSKLLTLIFLRSVGEDWALSPDRKRLYVSMPAINQVAVVDTATWQVVTNIDTGVKPVRVRIQSDGKYLWVGTDGANASQPSGVSIIDTETLKVAAHVPTGAGHHEIAFAHDDRYALVTNQQDGTLSVLSVARLAKLKDIKTGASPVSLAYSSAGRAAYVLDESDGSVVVVDPERQEVIRRIATKPGAVALRFDLSQRYGFVVNRKESVVHIFDTATNQLLHMVAVGKSPDQVTFTKTFAYVRALGEEQVTMINLTQLGKPNIEQTVNRFPGGQKAPQLSPSTPTPADALVPAPEGNSMLVANPADRMIYYYQEGMAAPMGSFQNYRRDPRALLVWDASLREAAPGVYQTNVRLTRHGSYDVAFLLDQPRVYNCFELAVEQNPAVRRRRQLAINIEPLSKELTLPVRQSVQFRFKVTDTETGRPRADLKDMGVLVFLAPGIWQERQWARPVGEGVYEVNFTPPRKGAYYVFFECPSLGIAYNKLPHLVYEGMTPSANRDVSR